MNSVRYYDRGDGMSGCIMEDGQCRNCGAIEIPAGLPDWFVRFHNRLVRLLGGPAPCEFVTAGVATRPFAQSRKTAWWQAHIGRQWRRYRIQQAAMRVHAQMRGAR